jgi:hypothetical protein
MSHSFATLPLRFHDPRRITFPSGGIFVDSAGNKVAEDETADVLKSLKRPQLFVRSKATSSGVLINRRVYPGTRMKNSAHHFLKDFGKPFLDRHPSHGGDEPKVLGRITQAEYVQVWSDKAWTDDWRHPRPNGHAGSGHIVLGSVLTDQEAIARAVDQRLLTTSVGFRPTAFFCSICGQDWVASDSPCGHELGKHYDVDTEKVQGRRLAYGITGDLIYDHVAETWVPADPTAQILSSTFQDSDLSCFDTPEPSVATRLDAFVLTDTDGRTFELDLAMQAPADAEHQAATTQVFVGAVVDLSQRLAEEGAMAKKNDTVLTEGEAANLAPDEEPKNAPAEETSEEPTAGTENPPAESETSEEAASEEPAAGEGEESGEEGEAEANSGEAPQMMDVNGNWTMPDPVDGHVHELVSLDRRGAGRVSMVAGSKIPKHDHELVEGRLMPTSGGDDGEQYVSRHPNTFFFDKSGKTWQFNKGEKVYVDLQTAVPADSGDYLCPFPNDEPEFVISDDLTDQVETLAALEMADMIEESEFLATAKLKDAALTAAQRKKVPTRLFCGPDRSFPVPDKARVRNALARLGQGFPKGASASVKARIRACVLQRAKQLGVSTGEGSGKGDEVTPTVLHTLSAELDKRAARINQLEGTLKEREDELKAMRDESMAMTKRILDNQIDRVLDLKLALGKPDVASLATDADIKTARQELAKRSVDSLADAARDLQLELAQGKRGGVRPDPTLAPPVSKVGGLGGAPTAGKGSGTTLADKTLALLSGE